MNTRLVNPHDCQYVQSRVTLDVFAVAEYEDMMERGIVFEPCKGILSDDGAIIIYDGNHRAEAAKSTGAMIQVDLTPGTAQDAEWQASGANTTHGVRRTASDVEKSVKAALHHPHAQGLSDREIARHCGCDHKTVGKYRKDLEASGERPQMPVKTVTRNGTEYQMTIPMPKEPEPEPARNPSPVVYDAHMPKSPDRKQPKASIEQLMRVVKDWLFVEHNFDVETAQKELFDAIHNPIYDTSRFNAIATYVERRGNCIRSDIRQACKQLLENTQALQADNAHQWEKQNLVTKTDKIGLYDEYRCERCGVTVKRYGLGPIVCNAPCKPAKTSTDIHETPDEYDENPFPAINALEQERERLIDVHQRHGLIPERTGRCMDCGETFWHSPDQTDVLFCHECRQAHLRERARGRDSIVQTQETEPIPAETSNELTFLCHFCGKHYPESSVHVKYKRTETAKLVENVICAKCVMTALREITRYDDIAKPYSCPDCGYKFQAVAAKFYADDDTSRVDVP